MFRRPCRLRAIKCRPPRSGPPRRVCRARASDAGWIARLGTTDGAAIYQGRQPAPRGRAQTPPRCCAEVGGAMQRAETTARSCP
jgi:hypothetical protein